MTSDTKASKQVVELRKEKKSILKLIRISKYKIRNHVER
jgi:hypothetical protein